MLTDSEYSAIIAPVGSEIELRIALDLLRDKRMTFAAMEPSSGDFYGYETEMGRKAVRVHRILMGVVA